MIRIIEETDLRGVYVFLWVMNVFTLAGRHRFMGGYSETNVIF